MKINLVSLAAYAVVIVGFLAFFGILFHNAFEPINDCLSQVESAQCTQK